VGACVLAIERGTPIRITTSQISWFFREAAAHAVVGVLLLVGWWPSSPEFKERGQDLAHAQGHSVNRRPVLLVHGYGLNRRCFHFLKTYLHTRGWGWVWAINHRPLSSPISVFAERLGRAVDRLRAETGADQIDIVAHSMGGLVSAWYMAKLDGAQHVRRLITLGTPWSGSRTHVFGLRREARDVAPGAEVISDIRDLKADVVAIWSHFDHLVIPNSSAAPERFRCIEFDHLGHVEMLFSARVFRRVTDELARDGDEE
jgi:pimeloyl-ACP methyl ester carboxylesterase